MTTWKDGGDYGRLSRQITNKDGERAICTVWTKQNMPSADWDIAEPWPEGEANFALILQAPRMLEALEEIAALKLAEWGDSGDIIRAYNQCKEIARAAIAAAVKGEDSEAELV